MLYTQSGWRKRKMTGKWNRKKDNVQSKYFENDQDDFFFVHYNPASPGIEPNRTSINERQSCMALNFAQKTRNIIDYLEQKANDQSVYGRLNEMVWAGHPMECNYTAQRKRDVPNTNNHSVKQH